MIARVERERPEGEGVTITRLRHHDALRRAEYHLEQARQSLSEERSGEFIALDLRMALAAAGELTGEVRSADILEDIFSTFCIGK
ncbi:MAG: tRNA modification GTPase MnmE [bacterium ADurb.Bin431]|nr:MAG: tRNA modification GTPase MnmE [bacterium ADurb.Bin431]